MVNPTAAELDVAPAAVAEDEVFVFPVSFNQQRLWLLDRLGGGGSYGVTLGTRFTGALDAEAMRRALETVATRHEALRTTFAVADGEPVQVVRPPSRFELPVEAAAGADPDAEARHRVGEEARRPFDLRRGPLFRALLLRHAAEEHTLVLSMHHIVSDGWSLGILFRELGAAYAAHLAGGEPELAELPIQFGDYAVWERETLQGEALEERLSWWRGKLAGAPALLELPTDYPRPAAASYRGGRARFRVDPGPAEALRALAREEGATLFMVMLSAWQLLLSKYSGQDDVVVGTSIAGRTQVETEGLIGFFVNTLALRTGLAGDPTFRALLGRVREGTLGAFAHQDVPFDKLVDELQVGRTLGYNPLFQAFMALQNAPGGGGSLPGLRGRMLEVPSGTAKFDLSLLLWEGSDGAIEGWLEYATELFSEATVRRMSGHLRVLAEAIAAGPDRRLGELTPLSPAERAKVLDEWNPSSEPFPVATLHRRFEARAAEAPSSVAVTYEHESLSYGELNARANRLARHLQSLGVGPESRVGLCVERGMEMVVGILGILKAGGAYVPLDPTYPEDRLAYMVGDAGISVLVTQAALAGRVAGEGVARVAMDGDADTIARHGDGNLDVDVGLDALAYVIYTSGSTGRPKGAMLTHANVARLFTATDAWFDFGASDVWTMFHSYAFDFSVWEIWGALLYGGRLVVVPFLTSRSPEQFRALLRDEGVTVLDQTPSAFQQLIQADAAEPEPLTKLRCVVFGGEALQFASLRPWLDRYGPAQPRLVNMYGITETCVHVTYHPVTGRELRDASAGSTIGRQIPDLRLYVLDPSLRPAPVGVPGELFVGGAGLARGYLGRPALTAERFVPDPFGGEPGARLYRSGDRARWKDDGTVEYLGRIDFQVKVRGFRIELGEIEAALLASPLVRECAVLVRDDAGEAQIVAYAVPAHGAPTPSELREAVRTRLPDYMVPGAFVVLDALPLTDNGKLDRRALPAPDASRGDGDAFTGPRTPVEEVLAAVWAEVLATDRIGADDDFFALGGHSLRATQVASRVREVLGVDLPLRSLFENPTLGALAETIEGLRRSKAGTVLPPVRAGLAEEGAPVPLSFSQQRLWFLDRMQPGGSWYIIPSAMRLAGPLDAAALERALAELVRRHDALRTTFAEGDAGPVAVVHAPDARPFRLEIVDASSEEEARAAVDEGAWAPFDLVDGPLFRARLVRRSEHEHLLVTAVHHVVSDGWSGGVLLGELTTLYSAFARGEPSPLAPIAVRYADFAVWQRDWLRGEVLEAQLAFWRQRLAGAPPLELPTDHPRPAVQQHRGGVHRFAFAAELARALKELARREGSTPFMLLLAAWQATLSKWTGQDDLVVGTPIANRTRRELEPVVGLFANTLALRADLSGDPTFRALLARVRGATLDAYAHQDLPFEKLVEELRIERDLSRAPLVQVLFTFQTASGASPSFAGLEASPLGVESGTAKLDLLLGMYETPHGMGGALEYDADLFDAATVERLVGHLRVLLEAAAADPEAPLSRLPILSDDERMTVVERWNATSAEYPADARIHALIAAQAARTPERAALVFAGREVTYAELDARANQLARHLEKRGVGPEVRVGVCMERSVEMVVSLLAILKAGGAYVPLDPGYPADRVAFMLGDAGVPVLLTQDRLRAILPLSVADVVAVDDAWPEIARESAAAFDGGAGPDTLAYVIYTSGSTGRPKGVMNAHRGVCNRLRWMQEEYGLRESDRVLQKTPFSFDVSVWEFFWPLMTGATLVVAKPEGHRDAGYLADLIAGEGVTVAHFVPSMLSVFLDEPGVERAAPLRLVFCSGEALPAALQERFFAVGLGSELHNLYGPTEAAVDVTYWRCRRDPDAVAVPIGRPVANTRTFVLDAAFGPVPVGVAGELFLGGVQVARGYLNRPALTAEKFVPDPFSPTPGARLYRTGDRARWRTDGAVDFLGRLDFQVKVRGFRIELGEIETALLAHPSVREAVVVAREDDGEARLAAYVTGEAGEPEAAELRRFLRERLPEHMVPSAFVALAALPLSPNGKLDRRALPAPEARQASTAPALPPSTELERLIAETWREVLEVEAVGVEDNFFDLGGHSLLLARVHRRLAEWAPGLSVIDLFQYPTVRALARFIESGGTEEAPAGPAVGAQVRRDLKGRQRAQMQRRQAANLPRETQCD